MHPYPKIKTVWTRNPITKYKTLIPGHWATPVIAYLQDAIWIWYEKVDGTNIRATYFPLMDEVEFRGRAENSQIPPFLLEALEERITPDLFKRCFDLDKSGDTPITLYGEGFGRRIQKIGEQYGEPDFCLFDIRIGDYWMTQEFVKLTTKDTGLQTAPVFRSGTLRRAIEFMQNGDCKSYWGDFLAEGFVLRPMEDLYDRHGQRIISKIKYKDFPHGR